MADADEVDDDEGEEYDDFKVGDLVRLRSDGPTMTVKAVELTYDEDSPADIECQWFGGKKLEEGTFPSESLEQVTDAESKK